MNASRVVVSSRFSLSTWCLRSAMRTCKIGLGLTLFAGLFFEGSAANAAQIVAFDLKAAGAVRKSMAESLSPILLAELARQDGMSVVSQADIRALLELEGAKAALGCDEGGCMAEIAGSLGAELLVTSTLSKVGREWVVSMTLIQVDGAKILRRSTGKGRGKVENAATAAIENAVHQLFKGALPNDLKGPASMTRRGFKAALAGLHQALLDPSQNPQASRKRIVLDLVATELDYDAAPKLDMLDLRIRRGSADCRNRIHTSKSEKETEGYLQCGAYYAELYNDLGRVKEIRERSRSQGTTPSARPLRFLEPDPLELLPEETVQKYFKISRGPNKVLARAFKAYEKGNRAAFLKEFAVDKRERAGKSFDDRRRSDKNNHYSYALLKPFNYDQRILRYAAERVTKPDFKKLSIYLVKFKRGEHYSTVYVRFELQNGKWKMASWF